LTGGGPQSRFLSDIICLRPEAKFQRPIGRPASVLAYHRVKCIMCTPLRVGRDVGAMFMEEQEIGALRLPGSTGGYREIPFKGHGKLADFPSHRPWRGFLEAPPQRPDPLGRVSPLEALRLEVLERRCLRSALGIAVLGRDNPYIVPSWTACCFLRFWADKYWLMPGSVEKREHTTKRAK